MFKYLSSLFFLFLAISSDFSFAEPIGNPDSVKALNVTHKLIDPTSPVMTLSSIITYAIGIAGILGIISMTWGGIQMVLSTGDDEKLKKGRSIMVYSLVGVILAGLAYTLVKIVGAIRI
jgi:hypothetical protein